MPFKAADIANYFISQGKAKIPDLTPMKLQKLIYFAQGWHLALTDKPLIDEFLEAWPYGPVAPSLYHELKRYGSGVITEKIPSDLRPKSPHEPTLSQENTAFLDKIIEVYGKFDGPSLSNMSHEPDGPWDRTRKKNPDIRGADISNDVIRDFFKVKATTK
jgi:uncharacterized phage-associated protein